jgi:transcriptional regulator with XRE-family HTH domain
MSINTECPRTIAHLRLLMSRAIMRRVSGSKFAARLRTAREARGITVNQLNRLAKLSAGSVSRLEFGDRPNVSIAVVEQLAHALGVPLEWLWQGRDGGVDQLASTFFMAVDRRRVRDAIERQPGRWMLSTVAAAVQADVALDAEGVPVGGWAKLFAEVESGNVTALTQTPKPGPAKRPRRPARKR